MVAQGGGGGKATPAVHWILHEAVLGARRCEAQACLDALGMSHETHAGRTPHDWRATAPSDRPVLALVTLQMASRMRHSDHRDLVPGVFFYPDRFRQSHYTAHLGSFMANQDQVFVPWAEFVRRGVSWIDTPQGRSGRVFVRPDSGFKVFTGQMLPMSTLAQEVHSLETLSGVVAETMVGVSSPKDFDPIEWRFWIVDGGVAAVSAYSWDEDALAALPDRRAPSSEAVRLAEEIARHRWQIDRAYVADIATGSFGPRLLEVNSVSCSGLYDADLTVLFPALAALAVDEWRQVTCSTEMP